MQLTRLTHIPSDCWLMFFVACGMLIMAFQLRKTETIPKGVLRTILTFVVVLGLVIVLLSIARASFFSRHWIEFEEAIARLTAQECNVEVNGKQIVEKGSFLQSVRKIEEIKQRKKGARRKNDVLLQSEAETFHFELWEDARWPNEYWVMVFDENQEPFRIGTVGSPELRDLLIQYDRKKSR